MPTLAWTRTMGGDATLEDEDLNVPETMRVKNTFLIQASVTYHYTPVVGGKLIGPMTFSDTIYMNPRRTDSISKIGRATSELQSLMRISYAVFCLKKKNKTQKNSNTYRLD